MTLKHQNVLNFFCFCFVFSNLNHHFQTFSLIHIFFASTFSFLAFAIYITPCMIVHYRLFSVHCSTEEDLIQVEQLLLMKHLWLSRLTLKYHQLFN